YAIRGASVTASVFDVLAVKPVVGRVLRAEEERPGGEHVVVISARLAQKLFGEKVERLPATVLVNGSSCVVVGIMPTELGFPESRTDLWEPLAVNPQSPMAGRSMHYLQVIGRLKNDVSVQSAAAEMSVVAARLQREYPNENANSGITMVPYVSELTSGYRRTLLTMLAAVSFLLLVVCANVANLLLTRTSARTREIAVRTAIGASRWGIIRQMLIESIVLAICGGFGALAVAKLLIFVVLKANPLDVPRIGDTSIDIAVAIFAFGLACLTAVVFGFVPALHATNINVLSTLRESASGATAGKSGQRIRSALVSGEIALALALAVGAGLFAKSFWRSQSIDPGFRLDNIAVAEVNLPASQYHGPQRIAFLQQSLEKVRANPQVVSASLISHLPLASVGPTFAFTIEGRPALHRERRIALSCVPSCPITSRRSASRSLKVATLPRPTRLTQHRSQS
ncbi:MAG: ABC transporter permease, partial [Terriglobales bacterium]